MRVKIVMEASNPSFVLPFNYQEILSQRIHAAASAESIYLPDDWFLPHVNFPIVFSDLMFGVPVITPQGFKVNRKFIDWHVSSHNSDMLLSLIDRLFKNGMEVGDVKFLSAGNVVQVEPTFTRNMTFKCLSPIGVVSSTGRVGHYHYHCILNTEAELFASAIRKNLLKKFSQRYNFLPGNTELDFNFDTIYTYRKEGRISRLVKFNDKSPDEFAVKSFMAPFSVTGNPELIRIGYELGFGNYNHLGFGMVGLVHVEQKKQKKKEKNHPQYKY
jgi:CRISPR-associated endoribonuclease Cas6